MKSSRIFHGWVVIGVCFLSLALSRGIQLSFAIFFVEMLQEFGWSRGGTAFIQSTNLVIGGSSGVLVGMLVDRWGSRRVLLVGCCLYALGLMGLSSISSKLGFFIWWGFVGGIGSTFLGFVPIGVVVSHWFVRRRGSAAGIAFAGVGVGAFVLLPLTEAIIQWTTWRRALQILALLLVLLLVPVIARFLRESPEEIGEAPDGRGESTPARAPAPVDHPEAPGSAWTIRSAIATLHFWLFFTVWLCTSISMLMILTHQVAHTIDRGFDRQSGVYALGVMGLLSAVGRPLFGILSDHIPRHVAINLSLFCSFTGILALTFAYAENSGYLLIVYAILFGLGFGSRGPIMSAMMADRYSGPHFGAIYGAASGLGVAMASLTGPWFGGWIFDRTGAYTSAFLTADVIIVIAGVCAWLLGTYKPQGSSRSTPAPAAS